MYRTYSAWNTACLPNPAGLGYLVPRLRRSDRNEVSRKASGRPDANRRNDL